MGGVELLPTGRRASATTPPEARGAAGAGGQPHLPLPPGGLLRRALALQGCPAPSASASASSGRLPAGATGRRPRPPAVASQAPHIRRGRGVRGRHPGAPEGFVVVIRARRPRSLGLRAAQDAAGGASSGGGRRRWRRRRLAGALRVRRPRRGALVPRAHGARHGRGGRAVAGPPPAPPAGLRLQRGRLFPPAGLKDMRKTLRAVDGLLEVHDARISFRRARLGGFAEETPPLRGERL